MESVFYYGLLILGIGFVLLLSSLLVMEAMIWIMDKVYYRRHGKYPMD